MGKLEDFKAELLTAKATLEPQIEGLHDFARLNLEEDTKGIISKAIEDYERRLKFINDTLATIDVLAADNYPAMPVRAVIQAVFEDLKNNVNTIEAAFEQFSEIGQATTVVITPGTPVPKTPKP